MAETKDVVESKFEEVKKRLIAKHDEFVKEVEEALNKLFMEFSRKFSK